MRVTDRDNAISPLPARGGRAPAGTGARFARIALKAAS